MVISFVSGKGGVGKTSLAANFAWVCGRVKKTVLIDLDFQNQGATGLFLGNLPHDVHGALDALIGSDDFANCLPVQVENNVFFVPAVSLHSTVDYSKILELMHDIGVSNRLAEFLTSLRLRFNFDVLVLDCHGGLDDVSMAAHTLSNETLLVTEADTVTFNGTLELLEFYSTHKTQRERAAKSLLGGSLHFVDRSPQFSNVSFIVNRLSPKYRFRDLDSAYKRLIANYQGSLRIQKAVLSFIPEEGFLADSFGEYPFCVKLAPKAVVARKLQLIMIDLLKPDPKAMISYRPLKRLRRKGFCYKVRTVTLSDESRNTNNIIFAFGWLCLLFSVGAAALFSASVWAASTHSTAPDKVDQLLKNRLFGLSLAIALSLCLYYCIRAQLGLMFYYREKYRFRRALQLATKIPLTIWQILSLVRLRSLQIGVTIGPLFITLFLLVYFLIGIMIVFEKL